MYLRQRSNQMIIVQRLLFDVLGCEAGHFLAFSFTINGEFRSVWIKLSAILDNFKFNHDIVRHVC